MIANLIVSLAGLVIVWCSIFRLDDSSGLMLVAGAAIVALVRAAIALIPSFRRRSASSV